MLRAEIEVVKSSVKIRVEFLFTSMTMALGENKNIVYNFIG